MTMGIKHSIMLVPFVFDDSEERKLRPVLCLTEPVGQHRHVIVAFISSQIPDDLLSTDIPLLEGENGFRTSGLKRSSVIRLHKLLTVRTLDMKKRLGHLAPELGDEIVTKLHALF